MRMLNAYLDPDTLIELKAGEVADYCERALDASALGEELEEFGPFAPFRKRFCEYLGIGESTLTGWLKEQRIPRMAKESYVLLLALQALQEEVRRLRREAGDVKIVQDIDKYHLVVFSENDAGSVIGRIVARDISSQKMARVFAGSITALRMLSESREVIRDMLGRTENDRYVQELEELDQRILRELVAALHPEKWRTLFGPIEVDLDQLLAEEPKSEAVIEEASGQSRRATEADAPAGNAHTAEGERGSA